MLADVVIAMLEAAKSRSKPTHDPATGKRYRADRIYDDDAHRQRAYRERKLLARAMQVFGGSVPGFANYAELAALVRHREKRNAARGASARATRNRRLSRALDSLCAYGDETALALKAAMQDKTTWADGLLEALQARVSAERQKALSAGSDRIAKTSP